MTRPALAAVAAAAILAACNTHGTSRPFDTVHTSGPHAEPRVQPDGGTSVPTSSSTTVLIPPLVVERVRATTTTARASRKYLRPEEANPSVGNSDLFDALARCESGMRRVTPGPYHSYFQWQLSTWHSIGGQGMPEDADYETQKALAQKLVARSGWSQFPACSRKIGAR